ncbi:uncharacterized protein [Haliotis cracherodii]|uniref:uncharacterized protein n=1 Tax=Haliotis cracherodii TaxID=6455 RepID=UPI0039E811DA
MTGIFVSVLVSVIFASSVGAIPNEDLERYFKDMRKDVMDKLDGLEKSNKNLLNKLQDVEDAVSHEAEKQGNQEVSFPSNQASLNKGKPGKTKRGGDSETPHHENATSLQSLLTRKNQFVNSPTSGRNSRVFFRMMTSRKGSGGRESETPHHENAPSLQPSPTRKNQFVNSPTSGRNSRVFFRMMTSRKGSGGRESETPHEIASSRQPLQNWKNQFVNSPTSGRNSRVFFRMMASRKGSDQFVKSPTSGNWQRVVQNDDLSKRQRQNVSKFSGRWSCSSS